MSWSITGRDCTMNEFQKQMSDEALDKLLELFLDFVPGYFRGSARRYFDNDRERIRYILQNNKDYIKVMLEAI